MSVTSLVSMLGALALVLGLLFVAVALVKRAMPRLGRGGKVVELEVVQRASLGARQGLAVVNVSGRQILLGVGEGGVRFIAEIGKNDSGEKGGTIDDGDSGNGGNRVRFSTALSRAIKSAFVVALIALGSQAAAAQDSAVRVAPAQAAQAAQVTKPAPVSAARIDSMASKLAPQMSLSIGEKAGGLKLSGTVGIVVMMGLLTLLPAVVLMMTGFTRILIVLHFLRQAIGAQSAPPAQLVAGLSLLLTLFVMAPTLEEVNEKALAPWMDGKMEQTQMLKEAVKPFRSFMLRQTREADIANFVRLSHTPRPASVDDVPLVVLTSAFVTSELRVSFQIGFALFLPFIVIDIVVASVLMSMGMMMVPPAMISLPFKLLLFVLVDGWAVVIHGLVQSFH
ncbi:MAG TPA: flagellar type III secretion system pore protein FliP [Gemmatimonadaceae bacterium]|nr:flagellar type III secretion system pore protein FliP [Gemmatimonadaceae bacterium]